LVGNKKCRGERTPALKERGVSKRNPKRKKNLYVYIY